MADPIRFHPSVAEDLLTALARYDDISPSLGNRFRKTVDAGFDAIIAQPEIYPTAFVDVRFLRLVKFPYLILFRRLHNVIMVLGVFHGASDPRRWRERAR